MRCSIKNINLPPAPTPTRAKYERKVVGNLASELQVIDVEIPPKPSPAINLENKLVERKKKKESENPTKPPRSHTQVRQENVRKAIMARQTARKTAKAEVVELHKEGLSVPEICKATGKSRSVVYAYLKEYRGLKRAPDHVYDERAAQLYEEGRTYAEIGEELGITASSVSQVLTRMRKEGKVGRRHKLWRGR